MFKFAIYGALAAAAIARVAAECPNACHNRGTCSAKDQCQCFKNYLGNDCAERICPFGRSWVDSPVGDLNHDGDLDLATTTVLVDSQMYPQGTTERAPVVANNEGHYYRECGMRGECNRETGECQCSEGFTGSACDRTTCIDDCNGVGRCETIEEFATDATGLLYGNKQSLVARAYDLWDAKVIRGCKCDPRYYGVSCSKRRCRVGIDPMYECAGSEILETVFFAVGLIDGGGSETIQDSYFRLRIYDYFGEMYETDRITLSDTDADVATATQLALRALPNDAFANIQCGAAGTGTFAFVKSAQTNFEGARIACEYSDNPGAHRPMELAESVVYGASGVLAGTKVAFVAPTSKKGEDIDYFASKSAATASITQNSATLTLSVADATNAATNKLLKVGSQIVIAADGGGTTSITMGGTWTDSTVSGVSLFYSGYSVTDLGDLVDTVVVGSTTITFTDSSSLNVGDKLFLHNVQYTAVEDLGSEQYRLDRPFLGQSSDGAGFTGQTEAIWKITNTPTSGYYQYVDECSGRGLCDASTGLCSCFKGYTNDNCDTQNIMAL